MCEGSEAGSGLVHIKRGTRTTLGTNHLTYHTMPEHEHPGLCFTQPEVGNHTEGDFDPFDLPLNSSAKGTADMLRLCLQGQVILIRAMEMEYTLYRQQVNCLLGRVRTGEMPVAIQDNVNGGGQTDESGGGQRPLVERIGLSEHQPPSHRADDIGGIDVAGRQLTAVDVRPTGFHPRFLPLRLNSQKGGGGPRFSRPQDWTDAIRKNPAMRPRGIRRWGTHLIHLGDLHIYI